MKSFLLSALMLVGCTTPQPNTFVPDYRNGQPNALVIFKDGTYKECGWEEARRSRNSPNWNGTVYLPLNKEPSRRFW